jgi:glycosyltransferase involved in cell wall biosynthesis
MKLAVLIPAYNEEENISEVIKKLPKRLPGVEKIQVIVVDDGSVDKTALLAKRAGAKVLTHAINLGMGNSYRTGLEFIKGKFDLVVTMDADGQHSPSDVKKIIQPILKGKADVVIGSRLIKPKGMPLIKLAGNWIMNFITYLFFGIWATDSQSGFRACNQKALRLIELKTGGYEVASEFLSEINRLNLKMVEVPIKVIYYKGQKGQPISNTANIISNLLKRNLR